MLDIIIPSYENLNNLKNTLLSFGPCFNASKISVTIIDDHSPNLTEEEYCDFLKPFLGMFEMSFIQLPENKGPGFVRQFGLDNTIQPYILWLDSGDMFNGPAALPRCLELIEMYPDRSMFTFPILAQNRDEGFKTIEEHNLFHGLILKRDFIQKYNLKMPFVNSYMHEDIPFVMLCNIIADKNNEFIHFPNMISIAHLKDPNSLTLKNNCELYGNEVISGYLDNVMWIIDNHPHLKDYFYLYLIKAMISIYFIYYFDAEYRKEANHNKDYPMLLKFYREYYKKYDQHDEITFNNTYYDTIGAFVNTFDPSKRYPLDIWKFISMLEKDSSEGE